ncbi:MAG TPA: putative quinol monooxygenase [Steroidobacteraceae bacterium]|nr:putative quinol monooxygenase [Steroidobacteraceae bacterium]
MSSEIFIFARFHAKEGLQQAVAETIREVLGPTRQESGCLSIHAYSATQDPRLWYVHSHWKDETAFDRHVQLPHTVRFVEKVQALIDHPLDVARTSRFV